MDQHRERFGRQAAVATGGRVTIGSTRAAQWRCIEHARSRLPTEGECRSCETGWQVTIGCTHSWYYPEGKIDKEPEVELNSPHCPRSKGGQQRMAADLKVRLVR